MSGNLPALFSPSGNALHFHTSLSNTPDVGHPSLMVLPVNPRNSPRGIKDLACLPTDGKRSFNLKFVVITMASRLVSKTAARAASTSTQTTKAAGDISSVFPSLRPDYQPEPLPPRFKDLKTQFFEKNRDALTQSWKRLLPSLQEEVENIKAKGSDVRETVPSIKINY